MFKADHGAYPERGWPVADPYVALPAIAATSARVRLVILVIALARRRPWKLAAVERGNPRPTSPKSPALTAMHVSCSDDRLP